MTKNCTRQKHTVSKPGRFPETKTCKIKIVTVWTFCQGHLEGQTLYFHKFNKGLTYNMTLKKGPYGYDLSFDHFRFWKPLRCWNIRFWTCAIFSHLKLVKDRCGLARPMHCERGLVSKYIGSTCGKLIGKFKYPNQSLCLAPSASALSELLWVYQINGYLSMIASLFDEKMRENEKC